MNKSALKTFTTQQIAEAIGGELIGDGSLLISRVSHPADIAGSSDLALAIDPRLLSLLQNSAAKAAVVGDAAAAGAANLSAAIVVGRGRLAMARLTNLFAVPVSVAKGIHSSAVIEPGALIGENVCIGAQSYIGAGAVIGAGSIIHPQCYIAAGAVIGENALLHAGVKINQGVVIGARVIIHFNASIGADGFSFVTPQAGSVESAKATGAIAEGARNAELIRIASLGGVVIGDDVEIGANSSIDQGTIAPTRIGNGTKIDNQVQIGHNVQIGENCLLCGRVGVAGSAQVGNRVVLGGASGVADHVKIGDDAIVMAMSGAAGNVPAGTVVGGLPAKPRERIIEQEFNIGRLKSLMKKVETLTARVDALAGDVKVTTDKQ